MNLIAKQPDEDQSTAALLYSPSLMEANLVLLVGISTDGVMMATSL